MNVYLQRWYVTASLIPMAAAAYYVVALTASFPRLPAQVPVHFGLDGTPDGWMNRYFWFIVSPALIFAILCLVFTTQPILGGVYLIADLMYWGACALVVGAFLQINRAAVNNQPLHFLPLFGWIVALPFLEVFLSFALKGWWLQHI